MTAPSVTVVIPTRDRPDLLRSAIAAVRAQDYPGTVDLVVVYDQSTPDSSLAAADLRVLCNDRSPGLAGARNTGVKAATGALVAFCDDDDEWLPGKLTAQVAALSDNAELVCCGIRVNYGNRQVARCLDRTQVTLPELLRDRLTELHPSTFLFRRSALVGQIGLVDEQIPGSYAEDYELLLRAARRHPIANLTTPYVLVRWHAKSYFSQRWTMVAAALEWLLQRYPEFTTVPAGYARIGGQIAFAHAALGQRRAALRWIGRTIRASVREPRAYVALAVTFRLASTDWVLRTLHRRGRGI